MKYKSVLLKGENLVKIALHSDSMYAVACVCKAFYRAIRLYLVRLNSKLVWINTIGEAAMAGADVGVTTQYLDWLISIRWDRVNPLNEAIVNRHLKALRYMWGKIKTRVKFTPDAYSLIHAALVMGDHQDQRNEVRERAIMRGTGANRGFDEEIVWDDFKVCDHDIVLREYLKYLTETYKFKLTTDSEDQPTLVNVCAGKGFVETLRWLTTEKYMSVNAETAEIAAKNGRLEALKYLWEFVRQIQLKSLKNTTAGKNTTVSLEIPAHAAAQHGQIEILKWIVSTGHTICSCTVTQAIYFGQIAVIEYLSEIWLASAHEHLSKWGQLENDGPDKYSERRIKRLVSWDENRCIKWPTTADNWVGDVWHILAGEGRFAMIIWLHKHRYLFPWLRPIAGDKSMILRSIMSGKPGIVKMVHWLIDKDCWCEKIVDLVEIVPLDSNDDFIKSSQTINGKKAMIQSGDGWMSIRSVLDDGKLTIDKNGLEKIIQIAGEAAQKQRTQTQKQVQKQTHTKTPTKTTTRKVDIICMAAKAIISKVVDGTVDENLNLEYRGIVKWAIDVFGASGYDDILATVALKTGDEKWLEMVNIGQIKATMVKKLKDKMMI